MSFKAFLAESTDQNIDIAVRAIEPHIDGRRKSLLDDAIPQLKAGLANKEIPNAKVGGVLDNIKRAWETAHSEIMKVNYYPVLYEIPAMDPKRQEYTFDQPLNIAGIPKAIRELDKLRQRHPDPRYDRISKFYHDTLALGPVMKELKSYAVKKTSKPVESRDQQTARFMAQFTPEQAKMVNNLFTQITQDVRKNLVQSFQKHRTDKVEEIVKLAHDPAKFRKAYSGDAVMRDAVNALYDVKVDRLNPNAPVKVTPHPDGANKLLQLVSRDVDDILQAYIAKNVKKLAAIISKKGNLKTAMKTALRYNGNGFESTVHFDFTDGARFTVKNSVVWVWNSFNTNFVRYPTTFHDVVNSDGSKMRSPSEEKMNKEFH